MAGKKPSNPSGKSAPANMCYFPFTQMLFQPTGLISPCCWNQDLVLGEVSKNEIMDIWNGEKMQKLRSEFLSGNPVSCERQMRHLGCHKWSHRLKNENFTLSEIQETGPKRLDLRLNGRCNLKCVMCDVWKQPNGLYDQSDFWKIAPTEIFPHLVELDVLGGEPLIQQDTYRLIREVSSINKKCSWAFVTNGQYQMRAIILNHLDLIPIRWIQVSIDSLDPTTYKAIRPGSGDLFRVIKTLKNLVEYRYERLLEKRPFELTVSICVQKKNAYEVGEFLDFARDLKVRPIVQFAYIPDQESLLTESWEVRQALLTHFESLLNTYSDDELAPVIAPLRDSLQSKDQSRSTQL